MRQPHEEFEPGGARPDDGAPAALPPAEDRPESAPEDISQWRHVHWSSPLVHAWIIVAVVLFNLVQNFGEDVLTGKGVTQPDGPLEINPWFAAVVFGVPALLLVFGYLSWLKHRFFITRSHVYLRKGVLFQSRHQVRLDRLQSVDMNQPLAARILGLTELKLVTADGEAGSDFTLAFLKTSEAKRLRTELLIEAQEIQTQEIRAQEGTTAHGAVPSLETASPLGGGAALPGAAGEAEASPENAAVPTAPAPVSEPVVLDGTERRLFRQPTSRVVGSLLLSPSVIIAALAVAAAVVISFLPVGWRDDALLVIRAGIGPTLIALLFNTVTKLPKRMNFVLAARGGRLVVSQGAASTAARAVRPERIHGVFIRQPLLWRPFGWYGVEYLSPGGAGDLADENVGSELLPVARFEEIEPVLAEALPEFAGRLDEFAVRPDDGFTRMARAAEWMSPFARKRVGFLVRDGVLSSRSGWLTRQLAFIPLRRIQSVEIEQGPVSRACGLARPRVHLVSGGLSWLAASHLPKLKTREAAETFDALRTRAVEAAHSARIVRRPSGPGPVPRPNPHPEEHP
ncbi:PH domain-containing protein [Arthrobacter sp. UM1]|uniref:PH domain-containing protein n=1 Tax=Arthrobacter sp. UM1 TaxID=2766776 RepID=UPI001CF64234|nr:PH domain-containing protein [Arthrobacter sp. UM1]MCB4208896.1 PH domain-containing protein [Arthrobacter sp. UM1]